MHVISLKAVQLHIITKTTLLYSDTVRVEAEGTRVYSVRDL